MSDDLGDLAIAESGRAHRVKISIRDPSSLGHHLTHKFERRSMLRGIRPSAPRRLDLSIRQPGELADRCVCRYTVLAPVLLPHCECDFLAQLRREASTRK